MLYVLSSMYSLGDVMLMIVDLCVYVTRLYSLLNNVFFSLYVMLYVLIG